MPKLQFYLFNPQNLHCKHMIKNHLILHFGKQMESTYYLLVGFRFSVNVMGMIGILSFMIL